MPLYVSKQTGEKSKFSGSDSKTTDRYESGDVTIDKTGPINYTVTPNDFSIGANQTKTWNGEVFSDVNAAPEAGNSTTANITGNYKVTFSRPAGTGSGGNVKSTYNCNENGGNCEYHGSGGGTHEIVEKTGSESIDFIVYSLKVTLPDTICLSANGSTAQAVVNAVPFPASGGNFQWTSLSPNISITNATTQSATITLNDTSKTGNVEVKFTIEGVSYKTTAFVKYCNCNCKPITTGATFGPITATFNTPPTSTSPDGSGMCQYEATNASFTLNMNGIVNKQFAVTDAKISFKKNCKTGDISDATFSWEGNQDIGEIKYIGASAKAFDLTVTTDGKLSGSVILNAKLTEDKDLTGKGIMMLRKGVNGDFKFSFSGGNTFDGSFDFLGVKDINIDIVKATKTIGQFKDGSLQSDGTLDGTLVAVGGAKYTTNAFTVTMNDLSLGFSIGLVNGFVLKSGSGGVTVSDIKGIKGTGTLTLAYNDGNCSAELSASNMKAFDMTLQDLNLTVNFNSDFDMVEFDGKLNAKHDKFDLAIEVMQFNVKDGELKKFQVKGKVKYNAFTFELLNSSYEASKLEISAKVELAVTGSVKLEVDKFTIDEKGDIKVGKIAGEFKKDPVNLSFSATFEDTRFRGTFNAQFTTVGLEGKIDVGAQPTYNFAYLELTAKTEIPLGPSGLKLTKIGGQGGFNYKLPDIPEEGNYVLGLTLGVADVAGFCEVSGNPIIQLGNTTVVLTLNGTINILKNNTFFTGKMNVNYKMPAQTIDGSVETDIKVPNSGVVFKSDNLKINFNIGDNKWSANGSDMGGKVFSLITLSKGNISINGQLDKPTELTGKLGGLATAELNQSMSASVLGNTVTGTIKVTMNSNVDANLDQNGLSGSFGVRVTGDGTLDYDTFITTGSINVNGVCDGQAGYNNGTASLVGTMTVNFPGGFPFYGTSINTGINIAI
ncbi:MAG: hypothetical protein EOP53_01065 [Sphingobacteriales bacterium]|nr:MAG: hypothetical protein EOP53_01065 [Sphingobacteriales bacterium]